MSLFALVQNFGGSHKVNQHCLWDEIYKQLYNRKSVGVNVSVALRNVYHKILLPFEKTNTSFTTDIAEDDDDSIAAKDQPTSFVLHSSLSQPSCNQVNVNSLSSSTPDPMIRLLCALGSGLANEIDFSLKVVTMLTNSRQISLVSDNRFVEALVNCISIGGCDCDVDDKCSCVRQFWSCKCKNSLIISLVFEDENEDTLNNDDDDNTGLTLYQQITNLSAEWTLQYSKRVKTVGDLIRRIVENIREECQPQESPEDEVISNEPASLSLLKFTALLLVSHDPEFVSIGLDIMTNIELSPKAQEPYSELRRLICLHLTSYVMDSLDIDVVTRSLDCLARLTQYSSEAFNKIAKDILTEKLLDRLIQLLTCQHDVHLVVASLEFCLAISQHHPKLLIQSNSYLVKILLNLVNCDATSHFSEYALKKIKVCDTRTRPQPLRTIICQPAPASRIPMTHQTGQTGVTLTVPGDNEAFVVNWLRNTYDASDCKNYAGVNDLYAEYVKYSLKNNRRNVVGVPIFSQIVLKTFPRVSLINGTRFDGIICKSTPNNTIHCKVFTSHSQQQQQQQATSTQTLITSASTSSSSPHGLLTSPILKAHLSAPPKTSPVATITSTTSSNALTSSPSTTTSTLIKSLLATKLQSKTSVNSNVNKDSSDDKIDTNTITGTLNNTVVSTPTIISSPTTVSTSNSQAVLISTPSVSAAGQPTQQLILVRTVIAPSHNNQSGGNIVGVNPGQVRLILPASAFTQQRPTLLQPTVNGTVCNSVNINQISTSQTSTTLSTVSISSPVTSTINTSSTSTSNDILMKAVLGSGISNENSKEHGKSCVKSSPLLNVLLDKGKLPTSDSQPVSSSFTVASALQVNQSQGKQQPSTLAAAAPAPANTTTSCTETPKMFILATKPSAPANQVINSVVRNGTKEKTHENISLTNGDISSDLNSSTSNNSNDNQGKINNKRSIDDLNKSSSSCQDIHNIDKDSNVKKTKVDCVANDHIKCASNGDVHASKPIELQPEVPKVSDLPLPVTECSSKMSLVSNNTQPTVTCATTSSVNTSTVVVTTPTITTSQPTIQKIVPSTPLPLEFVCEWIGCLRLV